MCARCRGSVVLLHRGPTADLEGERLPERSRSVSQSSVLRVRVRRPGRLSIDEVEDRPKIGPRQMAIEKVEGGERACYHAAAHIAVRRRPGCLSTSCPRAARGPTNAAERACSFRQRFRQETCRNALGSIHQGGLWQGTAPSRGSRSAGDVVLAAAAAKLGSARSRTCDFGIAFGGCGGWI